MTAEKMTIITNIQSMEAAVNEDAHTFKQLQDMDVRSLRDLQFNTIEKWNQHLRYEKLAKKMRLSIDEESVEIYIDADDPIHVVYWHLDEVKEDETVALVMAKAVQLFYTDPKQLLKLARL